jgi:hypothetical protein
MAISYNTDVTDRTNVMCSCEVEICAKARGLGYRFPCCRGSGGGAMTLLTSGLSVSRQHRDLRNTKHFQDIGSEQRVRARCAAEPSDIATILLCP